MPIADGSCRGNGGMHPSPLIAASTADGRHWPFPAAEIRPIGGEDLHYVRCVQLFPIIAMN